MITVAKPEPLWRNLMARGKEKPYLNPWLFNGKPFDTVPEGAFGFVYLITEIETGKRYLGKKVFWFKRKQAGKRAKVVKESDWKHYWSSCVALKDLVKEKGVDAFKREILAVCTTERDMNYLEVKYQFGFNILEQPEGWFNENINGNWYPKNYVGLAERTSFSIS